MASEYWIGIGRFECHFGCFSFHVSRCHLNSTPFDDWGRYGSLVAHWIWVPREGSSNPIQILLLPFTFELIHDYAIHEIIQHVRRDIDLSMSDKLTVDF